MALAYHVYLRRRGLHLIATLDHHPVKEVPALVGPQFQQALIHGRDGDLAAGGRGLAFRRHGGNPHLGLVPDTVHLLVGGHLHLQLVRLPPPVDLRDPQLVGGPAQIHQGRRLHIAHPAAHGQHGDEDVGRVMTLDRHLDNRPLARQRPHEGFHHAFTFDRHQRRCASKRHPHLKHRGLARLVPLAPRQQVHAVMIRHVEPPLRLASDPDLSIGDRLVTIPVLGPCLENDVSRDR